MHKSCHKCTNLATNVCKVVLLAKFFRKKDVIFLNFAVFFLVSA